MNRPGASRGEREGTNMVQWFLRRAAFILAICVLAGLVGGWFLPASHDLVMALAGHPLWLPPVVQEEAFGLHRVIESALL